jgi:capsular exopolysaccharide synthesis family protein
MAKTYEALMKAEEEARKKQAVGGPPTESHGPSTVDRGLSSPGRGPSTVDHGLPLEEYHRLKLSILRMGKEEKIKTLLFSSPTKGEGASTVLADFGIFLAGQGEKVLLVDANLRSPSLHQRFHLEMENGLAELMLGKAKLPEVVKKTTLENLWVIPSGTAHSNPPFFKSLESHVHTMREGVEWLLFDAPPINHFDEAVALLEKVDGVVMVLQAEKTRWEVAQSAKQRLEDSGGKILGVVLNKRKLYIPRWLYRTL